MTHRKFADNYTIDFKTPNTIGYFPSQLVNIPIQQYDVFKAHIDITVTQVRFFEGQPHMGWPHHYAVNGETVISDEKKIVTCICTDEQFKLFQNDPSKMIFQLMAGETIPEGWL